ncbi:hypothetical protein shim_09360 [Shimia sp. SK013]|uniref:hypothetical protein n=1 Tax=Shimia sp. SK013 TaxID=1389006 RepID=UPI0006B40A4D|nr:hypothetical protein [Shimia sp. SK013]KPA22649.1 hypothetical protein shim_09360 [Shimia sp. SK013]
MLRSISTVLVFGVALSACAPTSYVSYSKSGASGDTTTRTFAQCRQEANGLFPAAVFTESTPGFGGYGSIYTGGYGGGFGGSYVQARDANAPLRAQHLSDCMTLQGYRQVVHPICTTQQLSGRQYQTVARPPTGGSPNICAVRTENRTTVLIDLNKPL